jgi:hypothetical protein
MAGQGAASILPTKIVTATHVCPQNRSFILTPDEHAAIVTHLKSRDLSPTSPPYGCGVRTDGYRRKRRGYETGLTRHNKIFTVLDSMLTHMLDLGEGGREDGLVPVFVQRGNLFP